MIITITTHSNNKNNNNIFTVLIFNSNFTYNNTELAISMIKLCIYFIILTDVKLQNMN